MPAWVSELLNDLFFGPFFVAAKWIWDWCMGLSIGLISTSPQSFSGEAWRFVTEVLYPWSLGIGVVCLNLFFIIGFLKAVSNLKENITLELCIEAMIRLVAVNVLLQVGLTLVRTFFTMASLLAGQVLNFEQPAFYTSDYDVGSNLFWWLFGFGYFIVAMVCAIIIFLTLYGRYIKLYLLLLFYPIAIPTIAGGRGIESSAYAWVKTFLSNVFEIVVIALTMSIAGRLISNVNLPTAGFAEHFDGFIQGMHSIIYMILMATSVKGTSILLNKAFNL
jgi:hypothetical protein